MQTAAHLSNCSHIEVAYNYAMNTPRRNLVLSLWLLILVFPYTGLTKVWPAVRPLSDKLQPIEWLHILAHLVLFTSTVILLDYIFRVKINITSSFYIIVFILAVGIIQEALQLLVKGRLPNLSDGFDLTVDLIGGILGLGIVHLVRWRIPSAST